MSPSPGDLEGVTGPPDGEIPLPGSVPVALGTQSNGHLSYREARQAPCLTCTASPCCNYLSLHKMKFTTLLDADYATYLLNFEGIILGLEADGMVEVYFNQPCRYLDVPSGLCTVHGTPTQPSICVHYDAHTCWYRKAILTDDYAEGPFLDRSRLAWYVERLSFDDARRVVATPDWAEMVEAFRSMPLERHAAPPPPPDPVTEEWRSIVLSTHGSNGHSPSPHHYSESVVSDPCDGCGAWCCKTLVFGQGRPENASDLDRFRYGLGFPGVELGVADDGWAVIVRTTCRHLVDNRCSVFGTDERPLRCSYYDALKCKYRVHFGTPQPEKMVRVSREQFGILSDSVEFDDVGRVVAVPTIETLRDRLEDAERARV